MTIRFLYLAGSSGDDAPLAALATWMQQHGPFAFVLHGGNLAMPPTADGIHRALRRLAMLPARLYFCPSPSDLDTDQPAELWRREAPHLFPGNQLAAVHDCGLFKLHMLLADGQGLAPLIAEREGVPRIVCTAQPLLGRPAGDGQAGSMADRLLTNRCIRLILASHNDYLSHVECHGVPIIGLPPFTAPPHAFAVIDVGRDAAIDVSFHDLHDALPPPAHPNLDPTYTRARRQIPDTSRGA